MGLYLKLAFGNVRRSARDYSVYFATLGFAACLLYSFVASSDYLNRLDLSPDQMSVVASSGDILQAFSIFTVLVFLFLVRYANRFLLRRRSREFALYKLVGMDRGAVSCVLVMETACVGVLALVLGVLLGVALSPAFGAITAFVFDVPWHPMVVFSSQSAVWTSGCFAAVFALNAFDGARNIGRRPLIELIAAERAPEVASTGGRLARGVQVAAAAVLLAAKRLRVSARLFHRLHHPHGVCGMLRNRAGGAHRCNGLGRPRPPPHGAVLAGPARVHRAAGGVPRGKLVYGACLRVRAHRGFRVHDGGGLCLQRGHAHPGACLPRACGFHGAHWIHRYLLRIRLFAERRGGALAAAAFRCGGCPSCVRLACKAWMRARGHGPVRAQTGAALLCRPVCGGDGARRVRSVFGGISCVRAGYKRLFRHHGRRVAVHGCIACGLWRSDVARGGAPMPRGRVGARRQVRQRLLPPRIGR